MVAVARWAAKGKEQLVLIRPYREGLILHQLFYATEVRAFEDIDLGKEMKFAEVEEDLADKLIEQLAVDEFDAERFEDTFTVRVKEVIDQKIAGQEISVAPEQPRAQIIDLFEALKQSLDQKEPPKAEPKGVKKAAPRKKSGKKSAASG
jgi:DNA end-binding protein Ku